MGVRVTLRLLQVSAALCFAVTATMGTINCARQSMILKAEAPCPYGADVDEVWKPTKSQLHRILAQHLGWEHREFNYSSPIPLHSTRETKLDSLR